MICFLLLKSFSGLLALDSSSESSVNLLFFCLATCSFGYLANFEKGKKEKPFGNGVAR